MSDSKTDSHPIEPTVIEADVTSPDASLVERGFRPQSLFASLRFRDFQFFLSGAVLSNIGTWIQQVALGWLVLELTKSAFYVGLVNFTGNVPVTLLVLFAGVAADRLDRKKMIIWTQLISFVLALILAYLTQINVIDIPSIILISVGFGLTTAVVFPAWQAFLSDIVPKKSLMNAIALNSAQFHLARLIGPAVAGIIVASWGLSAAFYINAISFLAVVMAMLAVRPDKHVPQEGVSVVDHLTEGFRYVADKPVIRSLLLSVGMITLFGMSYATLMPVYVKNVLGLGASGFGFMMAANGMGAMIGALLVGALANRVKRETLIKAGATTFGTGLVLLGLVKTVALAVPILILCGCAFLVTNSVINTSLQTLTPRRLRGRVMSMFVFMFLGIMPFAGLVFGAVAEWTGVAFAISAGGAVTVLTGLVLTARGSLIDQSETYDLKAQE